MTVTVTFELPPEIEERLRSEGANLSAGAREAFALELYRQERLSHYELAQMLNLDQVATSELLQRHRIYRGALGMEDLEADRQTLEQLT